jgi:WD40 repeat protein
MEGKPPGSSQDTSSGPAREHGVKHDAFISYSRVDTQFAATLEDALERFRRPSDVSGRIQLDVFRDVNDFTAGDYESVLLANLKASAALIVVCTPNARASRFVDDEIRKFIALHGATAPVLPILLAGVPNNEAVAGQNSEMAFPEALSEALSMPLAVDYRGFVPRKDKVNKGRFESAWYMLLADLFGVSRSEIEQRDRRRQVSMRNRWVAALSVVAIAFAGLAVWAYLSRQEAVAQRAIAVEQQSLAEIRERAAQSARLVAESRNTGNLRSLMFAIEADAIMPSARTLANLVARIEHYWYVERTWWEPSGTWHRLAVTSDGTSMFTADGNGQINIWRLPSGEALGVLPRAERPAISLGLSGDETTLVGGSNEGWVYVWDVRARRIVGSRKVGGDNESIVAVAINHDASLMLAGAGTSAVMWTMRSAEMPTSLQSGTEVDQLAWAPDGARLVTGGGGPTMTVFDIRLRKSLAKLAGHKGWVTALQVAPDGRKVASATDLGEIRLWDLDRKESASLYGTHDLVRSISFNRTGRWLASGGREGPIRRWDLTTMTEIEPELVGQNVDDLTILPDDKRIVSTGLAGDVIVWNTTITHPFGSILWQHEPDAQVHALAATADGRFLASGDDKGNVFVIQRGTTNVARQLWRRLPKPVRSVAFSADSRFLVAASEGGSVRAWDLARDAEVAVAQSRQLGDLLTVAFQPNSHVFAAAGDDGVIRAWDLDNPHDLPNELADVGVRIWSLAFDRKATALVAGRGDGRLSFFELRNAASREHWALTATVESGHSDAVSSALFSPEAKMVVSGGQTFDSTIRFWNPANGMPLKEPIRLDLAGISKLALSDDGSRIAVAGNKQAVVLISNTLDIAAELSGPSAGYASNVLFLDDGDHVALASGNRIFLYDISRSTLLRVACAKAGRSFTAEEWRTLVGAGIPRRDSCNGKT